MKTIITIIALVAIMMGTASADMPSVLVGAMKTKMADMNGNGTVLQIRPHAIELTYTVQGTNLTMVADRDVVVYNIYTLIATLADALGAQASELGVDNGHPSMTIHMVDESNRMLMYYTVDDAMSMTSATLSEDVAANLVIT
jgi:hypothetical protein